MYSSLPLDSLISFIISLFPPPSFLLTSSFLSAPQVPSLREKNNYLQLTQTLYFQLSQCVSVHVLGN